MHMLRDLHPTLLSALEGIVDQMVWFRECWHEDVLRQLRQGLAKCYQVAFEYRGDSKSVVAEIIFFLAINKRLKSHSSVLSASSSFQWTDLLQFGAC